MGDKFWLGVGAVCIAGTVWSMAGGGRGAPKIDHVSAKMACEDAMRAKLKAPSTAEFSGAQTALADGVWTVDGHVDAQNSFGAQLRSRYTCSVMFNGATPTILVAQLL